MIIKNNLCNVSYMPIFEGKRLEFIGVKFNQAEKQAFERIASEEDRGVSYVVRELALRGLAHYLSDKSLKPTENEIKSARSIILHLDPFLSNHSDQELPDNLVVAGFDDKTEADIKKIASHIKKTKSQKKPE